MLTLGRRKAQSILIGDDIEVIVVNVKGAVVHIGIQAPRHVRIDRKEVRHAARRAPAQRSTVASDSHGGRSGDGDATP